MPAAMARQEGGTRYSSQTAVHNIHQRKQTQSTALQAWLSQQGQAAANAALCPASAFPSSPESPEQVRAASCGKSCLQAQNYSSVTVTYWSTWQQPDKRRPSTIRLEASLRCPASFLRGAECLAFL